MEFDSSRRLFLRRAGLAAVAPIIVPPVAEKLVKYFFAPKVGWRGASIEGLQYWQASDYSGTYAGIHRSIYPGRLSTPIIDIGGSPLTAEMIRRAVRHYEEVYG